MGFQMAKGQRVKLLDGELLRRRAENEAYLKELKLDSLLLSYRMEAGLVKVSEEPEGLHGGWEFPLCELRGHFLGHWLSASAMLYEATGDGVAKARADEAVAVLAECQMENGGQWASSIPEKYLYWIGKGKQIWAPQYTVHKTFMGLLDMYALAGNEQALQVAERFGAWFYDWSGKYTREEFQQILDVETGGMLEIWALLYSYTGKAMFRELMDRYYRAVLFDGLLSGRDVLTNMHANTTIPEVLGAAACYEATGEEKWLRIAEAYWKMAVTDRGTFATGGQTCGEIWTPMFQMGARLGDKNQEHCTVYNMMRLADFLFRQTGDAVYMDYWEKNLYNGIFAQGYWRGSFTHGQRSEWPTEGLLTYFLPLRAGGRKGWATRTNDFYCCHGTLVQANAALNTGMYYEDGDRLYICQFFDSDYQGEIAGTQVKIAQRQDARNGTHHMASDSAAKQGISPVTARVLHRPQSLTVDFEVNAEKEQQVSICIRIPAWCHGNAQISVNGEAQELSMEKGFAVLRRSWKQDRIRLELERKLYVEYLPDDDHMAAFLEGPVVLAGLCDEERTLYTDPAAPESVLVPDNERQWGQWLGTWKTKGQERGIRFVPLYQVGYERYQIYFPLKNGL